MGSSDFWIAFNIFLSAGLYLFDFATNILTAAKYLYLGKEKGQQYGISGIFPTILCIIIGAHVLNVIIFRCTLRPEERPVLQAYFFPLIQLWRLMKMIRATCTCRRMRCLESDIRPVYNILAVALESAPQFILQNYVLAKFAVNAYNVSEAANISILASLTNSVYNGFVAVSNARRKASRAGRLGIGVAGGVYTFGSLVIRARAFVLVSKLGGSTYLLLVPFLIGETLLNFAHIFQVMRQAQQVHKLNTFLECIAYSCMSFTVGPLYAMLKADEKLKKHCMIKESRTRGRFYIELTFACTTHLLGDITIFLNRFIPSTRIFPEHYPDYPDSGRTTALPIYVFCILYVCAVVSFIAIDFYAQDEALKEQSISKDESSGSGEDSFQRSIREHENEQALKQEANQISNASCLPHGGLKQLIELV